MPSIVLADCDALRQLPAAYAGPILCRQPTGSLLLSLAESSNFDLSLIIAQRGFAKEAEVQGFMDEVVRSRKPIETWLDPKQPLPVEAQAQRLVYQAHRSNGRKRGRLAERALALWPDCADAYPLLAQEAGTDDEALILLQTGLQAGKRALCAFYGTAEIERRLGAADLPAPLHEITPLADEAGEVEIAAEAAEVEFWLQQPTRPYMRVRTELAQALWDSEERAAALGHLRALLRLCPRDCQGNRYLMAGYLCDALADDAEEAGKTASLLEPSLLELGVLVQRYAMDQSAHWLYTHALWLFKLGEKKAARAQLRTAIAANRFVPALLAEFEAPRLDFDKMCPGSPEEAVDYLRLAILAWLEDEGALAALLEEFARGLQRPAHDALGAAVHKAGEDDGLRPSRLRHPPGTLGNRSRLH